MTEIARSPFRPSDLDLSQCVRCGLCLQHCPTYVETGLETESPRGRLYLMRALAEDKIDVTPNVVEHLDLCLQCRNCEAVCPSGVPYGRIMEHTRAGVLHAPERPLTWRIRALSLREIVAKPTRLRALSEVARATETLGLRSLAERLPLVGDRATLAPRFSGKPFLRSGDLSTTPTATRRVALLTGCIMPLAFGRVHRATVRVLARNGCSVVAPPAQVCCGALHAHNGDLPTARALARRNVDAFLAAGVDAVVVNSAGCGAAMKEYGDLLRDDPEYAEKAARMATMTRDISQFLVETDFEPPAASLDFTVTYQDSCHLAHAQRQVQPPRAILIAIPGRRLAEMTNPDRCCGAAGVYSFTQPEMSLALLDSKMRDIGALHPDFIATSNPGCMAQLEAGVRRHKVSARIVHVVELLDRAYRTSD
jgi:glycolate dehydrogenase iron-sulfur subunit